MNKRDLIIIRKAQPSDESFIYSSWLMGQYYGNLPGKGGNKKPSFDYLGSIDKNAFMKNYHSYIEAVLKFPETCIRVACLKEDEDVILGYSVFHGPVLNWVMVKPDWRGLGIMNDLVPKGISWTTSLTKIGFDIMKKRNWGFNPWA